MSNYKGPIETFLAKFGMTKFADRKRLARVRSTDVKENLQTILDYGHMMVRKLNDGIVDNMGCYQRINSSITTTIKELNENQPIYERFRSDREKLEREIGELEGKLDQASGEQYAGLEREKGNVQEEVENESKQTEMDDEEHNESD